MVLNPLVAVAGGNLCGALLAVAVVRDDTKPKPKTPTISELWPSPAHSFNNLDICELV
jgi:hypothetical protein